MCGRSVKASKRGDLKPPSASPIYSGNRGLRESLPSPPGEGGRGEGGGEQGLQGEEVPAGGQRDDEETPLK